MEDKIIGPFTMKQFIYLLISGGIVYGWWTYLQNNYVDFMPIFLVLAIPVGLLGVAFALLKINDRPFEVFILSFFQFLSTPKQRMWKEGYQNEPVIVKDQASATVADTGKKKDTRSLDDLSKSLDQQAHLMNQSAPLKAPAKPASASEVNVSVKDTEAASKKQAQAQKPTAVSQGAPKDEQSQIAPAVKKGGLFGIFGR